MLGNGHMKRPLVSLPLPLHDPGEGRRAKPKLPAQQPRATGDKVPPPPNQSRPKPEGTPLPLAWGRDGEGGQRRRTRAHSYQPPSQLTSAQSREVMEAIASGSFAKKFHAVQQASTMSS